MTNKDRWTFYCSDICSPNSFIDWGFYYIIASALQRRVWTGDVRKPLFSNIYVILTADPGVGKGLIVTEVAKVLRYHKLTKESQENNENIFAEEAKALKAIGEKPLLIPMGADATTYEALVKAMSRACRCSWFYKDGKKLPYIHSSICFCLEEISSLFRKHTEDLVRFLLVTYDCGDYRYDTVSRGLDVIKSSCLNLFGGTTPSFIKRIFGDELLTDGFASRTIFPFELGNRFQRLRPPSFNEEQIKEYEILLKHVKDLSELHGEVKFTSEAEKYLEHWWVHESLHKRVNNSPKLIPYYARKNITVQKLAMILHFSDSLEMSVNLDECKAALVVLEQVEKKMHNAINLSTKNPLAELSENILKYIHRNGPQSKKELLIEFWSDLQGGKEALDAILEYLITAQLVKIGEGKKYEAI